MRSVRLFKALPLVFLYFLANCSPLRETSLPRPFVSGSEDPLPKPRNTPVDVVYHKKTPLFFELADPNCTLEQAVEDLGSMQVWLRKKNALVLSAVDLSGVSGKGLSSAFTHAALAGYFVQSLYKDCSEAGPSTYTCQSREVQLRSSGKKIPICRRGGAYPQASLENAALATLAGIKQAWALVQPTADKPYPKVEVLIQPRLESILATNDGPLLATLTDNAFWSSSQRGERPYTIAILPHSRESQSFFAPFNMWEHQGVISHEYGHHVFYESTPHLRPSEFKLSDSEQLEIFLDEIATWANGINKRVIGRKDVIAALNEGIADLISNYAHDSGRDPLGDLIFGPFSKARNIQSCTCDDGEVKSLSQSALKHFFSPHFSRPHYALSADHQDIHTIGAIMAHGWDQLLTGVLGASEQNPETALKLSYTREWLSAINAQAEVWKGLSPEALLEAITYHGTEFIWIRSKNPAETLCPSIKRLYPIYSSKWLQSGASVACL